MPKAKAPAKKTAAPKPVQPATPAPTSEAKPTVPTQISEPSALKIVYDRVEITEYSSTSKHGPLTVEDAKVMLGWETEKQYQQRMVEEVKTAQLVVSQGYTGDEAIQRTVEQAPKRPDQYVYASWGSASDAVRYAAVNPIVDSKPEHWLFGEVFHCLNTDEEKVRCCNNANNRPFDDGWSEDIESMILTGTWAGPFTLPGETINGETVRISRYGRVLSAQHQGTGLIRADENLQAARAKYGRERADEMYPTWKGQDHCFIETIVITGLSEDERVLRTIDYVKPRTEADMLYTMPLFRDNKPNERNELTRMLAAARVLLWHRTDTKGYETHPEVVGFLERHKRLLSCVEHSFIENSAEGADGGRKISKLRISAGHASALCYLMACGSDKTTKYSDEYRNESPPSEKNLDWSYWDQALDFWTCLARERDFIPVRTALGHLVDSSADSESNQGLGGRLPEKLAILARAWGRFKDHPPAGGPPFDNEDLAPDGLLCLTYTSIDSRGNPLPNGRIDLVDVADFYGIDCPKRAAADPFRGQQEPPPPVGDEYERLKEEALLRRGVN